MQHSRTKIFIVEDENIIALDIKNRLSKLNYNVTGVASSGEEALRKLDEADPDLILMDILLKGKMDGVDTAREIKNIKKIPIVFLSSYSDDLIVNRAKSVSSAGYIVKPFNEHELKTKIEIALRHN
jgi:two-component system, response regulator PdtaR